MNSLRLLSLSILGSALLLGSARAADPAPAAPADKEAAYTKVLDERSSKIVAALELGDSTKAARVQARIIAQYRSLNAWQETHEEKLKELRKTKDAEPAKSEIAAIYAARKTARDTFLADLAKDLTPAQVDTVKDKLTYNKLQVTYNGYLQQLPSLKEEQKKKIYDWLLEAREEGIDGVSSHEKDEIFGKYKGRINNYLSNEGYDLKQSSIDWKARRDAEAASGKK
ncbi:hypothetical protein CMV30_05005 [Nibricoccus aquaticus]|uniref:DUF3826 domain-containing protein n=1 Tax=Nibricoccus aquaticus TaxID=2576891 RepID=A0A290QHP0_9BACT|nr:DUF3826 domain-containing protein [Nibricoccus aquaticus]ATC63362.1 hypothetical protein CMV30_05005 [Nibricoccus aquaticus]